MKSLGEDQKRLVLIDGNAILHRAYHALPPLTNRGGELVNAVYGFASMLLKILDEFKPDFVAVAFDTGKPTFRQQEFVGYQAKRPKMDEDLVGQTEKVRRMVEAFGFPILMAEGFEADDVIGSVSKKVAEKGVEVLVVTGDRDLMQIVGEGIKLYMPRKGLSEGEVIDRERVKERMGVYPEQIVDFKALVGDASDNYPGVPGIGPKTAVSLLERWGSLEEIYKKVEEGKFEELGGEKIGQRLKEGRESALLSQKLARILTDLEIDFSLEKLNSGYDKEKVREFFKSLGFRSLAARLEKKEGEKKKEEDRQQSLF